MRIDMMISKAVEHMSKINKIEGKHRKRKINDEYGTAITDVKPLHSFNDAVKTFNVKPVFDYCASDNNHVCKKYFTKKDNALTKDWKWDGFCNFPYSKQYEFMEKAWKEHQKNNIELLILAYSKTDTQWWADFVENKAEVHFIKNRIKFLDKNGKLTANQAPYPSCWIIYRRKKQ